MIRIKIWDNYCRLELHQDHQVTLFNVDTSSNSYLTSPKPDMLIRVRYNMPPNPDSTYSPLK